MEPERVHLRTYSQVWSQERTIYQIERVRLPFPVTFRQAGTFAGTLLLMMVISRLFELDGIPILLRYAVIPAASAWYLTSQRLDGKSPARWLLSMLRYAVSPRRLNRLRPLPSAKRIQRFEASVRLRLKG